MLSKRTKDILVVAMADRKAGEELASAIDSGSNPQAATVANFGATSNLTALVPTASALAAGTPVASAQGGTYDQTAINNGFDAKADQADFSQLVTDLNTALDLKSDNADVETLRGEVETRLDNIESKINAILTALKNAGLMA